MPGGATAMQLDPDTSRRPRVLLADDHRLVAEGLRMLLTPEFELVGVVEDGLALLEAARTLRPDVIVADISMPRLHGLGALATLRQEGEQVPVVFLTMHHDVAHARRALEAGAAGFVLKHSAPHELSTAIHAALEGKTFVTPAMAAALQRAAGDRLDPNGDPVQSLTSRQREILRLLAEGLSAKQIGGTLGISARTVEFHKYQAMERLDIHTSAELVHFAIKHGLVEI
jgi:DNA-binding NarL/FixJ family response regulator